MNNGVAGDDKRHQIRDQLLQLNLRRKGLEDEIKDYTDILTGQNVGMSESLVDGEGFPRTDIDVYQVRIARNKIITLQNDCRDLMKEIECKLHEFHALTPNGESTSSR